MSPAACAAHLPILSLRPNNWYVNAAKLEHVRVAWRRGEGARLPPVLVAEIDGTWSLIDGHARALAAWEQGMHEIAVRVEAIAEIQGSTALYVHIHREGPRRGILTVADLAGRVVDPQTHARLWIGYCERWITENQP